jgi:hypothetical protein
MREQRAYIPTRRRSVQPASAIRSGHSIGIHPEDRPYWTDEQPTGFSTAPTLRMAPDVDTQDDAQYNPYTNAPRMAVSSRRYTPLAPRTEIRVTHHQQPAIRRASTFAEQDQPQPRASRARSQTTTSTARPGLHWLVFVGLGMLLMLFLWTVGNAGVSWVQSKGDDLTYGRPRTLQTDASVGHNDAQTPSHFLAMNWHGHIIVIEFPAGDASKAQVYLGPQLAPGHDLDPVTLSFRDVNGDGKPDLVVIVAKAGIQAVFINDHGRFRPQRPSDHISL